MTLDIITIIRNMIKMVNPLAVFECDQARMLNVKVDTMERFVTDSDGNRTSSDFVYVEEPTTGYYDTPYRGYPTQRTIMQVYFCKFEPMANDAYKGDTKFSKNSPTIARLELKKQIEEQMVRPFLYLLKNSQLVKQFPEIMSTVRVLYPSSRFDANEVSVGLEFTFKQDWCIDMYKDRIWRPLLEVVKPGFDLSGRTLFFDRQDLPMPVYPPERYQALMHAVGLPLLAFSISQTDNFVAQFTFDGTDLAGDFIWTKEDGWKKSSVTYPARDAETEFTVVSSMEIEDIPEQYWSLKHCYIK
jgi:hypothetical protein|nr:MAG TPA: hypothetical protein [Caudoviricetes sp.]